MNNKYLFYVTLSYSFSILRPLIDEIKKNGGSYAWFIPKNAEAEAYLPENERRLATVNEVNQFQPDAVIVPGNYVPPFFPGIKVQVFHGFDSGKKNKFNIRGFFDLYCTQGPNITRAFEQINDGTCDIVETGWCKLDPLFTRSELTQEYKTENPLILYAPTFSPKLTSTYQLLPEIKKLLIEENWQWIVKLHPKATQEEIAMYKALSCEKLRFVETSELIPLLQAADVILSDTSSVLAEFALQNKPVVSFNNRRPEDWMINFQTPTQLQEMLTQAILFDEALQSKIKRHCRLIHPMQDGKSSRRTLVAIDSLIERGTKHLKSKPINLIRNLKMRKKLNYWRFW